MPRRDDGDYDDRPKKSWSEIDKARDGKRSGSTGAAPDRARERIERSATYSRYKSAADKFFAGELVPESLKERLDPTGEASARQDALRRLKAAAAEPPKFQEEASAYLARYETPEDPYLLDQMLAHPREEIVLKALEKLTELAEAKTLAPPKSLPQRLRNLELMADDPDVQDGAKRLARLLRDLPAR